MTSKSGLVPLPFSGGFYRSRSRSFNDKRLINWYVNYPDQPGLNDYQLLPCSGINSLGLFFGSNAQGFKGCCVMNGRAYTVNNGRLFRVDYVAGVWSAVDLTTPPDFIDDGPRIIMAAIKNQLVIVVPGVSGWHYTEGGSLVKITNANFLVPDSVVAIDSYFVFSQFGTNTVFSSALNDGLTYSALDRYITTQIQIAKGLIVYRNQLYVLGDNIIVPFSDQAQAQFAFRPIPNAVIDYGLHARHLVINVRDGFVFVGKSRNSTVSVYLYSSGAIKQLSTEAIDFYINKTPIENEYDVSSVYLMQYTEPGSECVSLTIGDYCFVYDFTSTNKSGISQWHERRSGIESDGQWSVDCMVNCYNRNIVFANNGIADAGTLDDSQGKEFGKKVRRVFNSQPFMGVNSKVSSLEIYTDVGIDDDSQLTISWSDDGGFSYTNKLSRSTGGLGDYGRRLVWNQLGGFRKFRMLQVEYTGEYPRAINQIMANVS